MLNAALPSFTEEWVRGETQVLKHRPQHFHSLSMTDPQSPQTHSPTCPITVAVQPFFGKWSQEIRRGSWNFASDRLLQKRISQQSFLSTYKDVYYKKRINKKCLCEKRIKGKEKGLGKPFVFFFFLSEKERHRVDFREPSIAQFALICYKEKILLLRYPVAM